jgi:hypothetical protein
MRVDRATATPPPIEELRDLLQHTGCPFPIPSLGQTDAFELHDGEAIFPVHGSPWQVIEEELRNTALHHKATLLLLRCVVCILTSHAPLSGGWP